MADLPQDDPRIYFAAERTFLAWIRSGLALMGVGFAIARFALFLRQMRGNVQTGLSVYAGVAVVVLGVLVLLVAIVQHLHLVRDLKAGTWKPGASRTAVALAALLAVIGAAIAGYLLLSH
jgi:putative membrane protein